MELVSQELEQTALGGMLSGQRDENGEEFASVLCEFARITDFDSAAHRVCFEAIESLVQARVSVGVDTVTAKLRGMERLNLVGEEYLLNLGGMMVEYDRARDALRMLRAFARARKILRAAQAAVDFIGAETSRLDDLPRAERKLEDALTKDVDLDSFETLLEGVQVTNDECEKRVESPTLLTGFREIDAATDGLDVGGVVIVGGESGGGKTALVIKLAAGMAETTGLWSLVFELEMPAKQIWNRVMADRCNVPHSAIKHRRPDADQYARMTGFEPTAARIPLVLHKPNGRQPNMREMADLARGFKRRNGRLGCVVIDFAQFAETGRDDETEERKIAAVAAAAKTIAMELECVVFLLSQLTLPSGFKPGHDKPNAGMLRGSKDLWHLASVIALLNPKTLRPDGHREVEFLIEKNRNGKRKTYVDLLLHEPTVRFVAADPFVDQSVPPFDPYAESDHAAE